MACECWPSASSSLLANLAAADGVVQPASIVAFLPAKARGMALAGAFSGHRYPLALVLTWVRQDLISSPSPALHFRARHFGELIAELQIVSETSHDRLT